MNVVFFGTSEFAAAALEAVTRSRHRVLSVVTQPQRQRGRGLKTFPQAVESFAAERKIRVLKFEDINSRDAISALAKEGAQIFIVAAFGQILSRGVLEIPGLYSINIHASLLPKYRGAAPIQWALINGEEETGVSIIRMNEFLDRGEIMMQKALKINEDDNAFLLSRRLSFLGAQLAVHTLDRIESNSVRFTAQDDAAASYAPKLKKEDGLIDWKKAALSVRNLVNGSYPWPSAHTRLEGRLLKLLEVSVVPGTPPAAAGSVVRSGKEGILVACGEGAVLIKRLQLEGKKPLSAEEFLRGRPLSEGDILR